MIRQLCFKYSNRIGQSKTCMLNITSVLSPNYIIKLHEKPPVIKYFNPVISLVVSFAVVQLTYTQIAVRVRLLQ